MTPFVPSEHPHRRYNPLTGEWILISPHRTKRPWQGKQEDTTPDQRPTYDPKCYLCPSNQRAGDAHNPAYTGTYVFQNDFSALLPEETKATEAEPTLLRTEPVHGECRVICFSPRHDLTLPEMEVDAIVQVVETWQAQAQELGQKYPWVQVFENKGAVMGCSNPHPHGQIWASSFLPNEITTEDRQQRDYYQQHQSPLLIDYAQLEMENGERVVVENEHWLAVVPYWAVWPYEILLMPKRHIPKLEAVDASETKTLADILKRFLTRYDNLFNTSFPYSMGWHFAPYNGENNDHWQLHAHFYPPLLRSATVKKFMVGYEMLAESQRDITASQAAEKLRSLSEVHFKKVQ